MTDRKHVWGWLPAGYGCTACGTPYEDRPEELHADCPAPKGRPHSVAEAFDRALERGAFDTIDRKFRQ